MGQLKISQLPDGTTITGAESIPVIQNGKTVKIPAGQLGGSSNSVIYKAAPSLTQADIGKIVSWSKDGAVVGTPTGGQQGSLGNWTLEVYSLPILPTSREIRFHFSEAVILDGDSISFSHPNFGTITYTFRTEAIQPYESSIGTTAEETAISLVTKIQETGSPINSGIFFITQKQGDGYFTVGMYAKHSGAPWAGGQSLLTYSFSAQGMLTSEADWTDGCMALVKDFKDMYVFAGGINASFADIFSQSRSNGYIFAGYRFPENLTQYRENIRESCYNQSYGLQWVNSGDTQIQIRQINLDESFSEMQYAYPQTQPFGTLKFTISQQPAAQRANLVPGHVLGQLMAVSNGNATVGSTYPAKVKIVGGNVVFNSQNPRILFPNRIGILYENGGVIPLESHPDSELIFENEDIVNGSQFFELLEEGKAGDKVYARLINFIGK